jgi:hypothetical protein
MNIQDLQTNISNDIQKLKDIRSRFDNATGDIIKKIENDDVVNVSLDDSVEDKEIEAELSQFDDQLNWAILKFATKS